MKSMDTQRLVLFFVFSFSLLMIWTEWEKEQRPKPVSVPPGAEQSREVKAIPGAVPTPAGAVPTPATVAPAPAASPAVPAASPAKGEVVQIRTDLLVADIDTLGAS